ncbi:MAG: hypothetical protein LBM75_05920 [Myxococcales bacterium]|jgi:16S rRNA (cytosine967-C5)-methyltransferase|nr:hypothetical protein [Myxococcales bacterium]
MKRPLRHHLIRAAVLELYAAVRVDGALADRALERLLKREKNLFSAERRAIGEDLFLLLRRERFLDFALRLDPARVPSQKTLFDARYAALRRLQGDSLDRIACDPSLRARLAELPHELPDGLPTLDRVALIGSIPNELAARLIADLGETDALGFAQSLLERAPLTIRANALKTTRDDLRRVLRCEGIESMPTVHAPHGLTVRGFPRLTDTSAFDDGLFEIQDEGSQLLAHLVGALPGERVVDACAGAGGKTLALSAQMADRGALLAFDVDAARLKNLTRRANRAGVHAIQSRAIPEDFDAACHAPKLRGRCDRVLIDAPCSGLGVLRRAPDARYRLSASCFDDFAARQSALLDRLCELTRPGGRLVYATCSLARVENEAVVERFLASRPDFSLIDAATLLPDSARGLVKDGFFKPLPHRDGCDGFFGAAMERS